MVQADAAACIIQPGHQGLRARAHTQGLGCKVQADAAACMPFSQGIKSYVRAPALRTAGAPVLLRLQAGNSACAKPCLGGLRW